MKNATALVLVQVRTGTGTVRAEFSRSRVVWQRHFWVMSFYKRRTFLPIVMLVLVLNPVKQFSSLTDVVGWKIQNQ